LRTYGLVDPEITFQLQKSTKHTSKPLSRRAFHNGRVHGHVPGATCHISGSSDYEITSYKLPVEEGSDEDQSSLAFVITHC
jgi:hypothetical protein